MQPRSPTVRFLAATSAALLPAAAGANVFIRCSTPTNCGEEALSARQGKERVNRSGLASLSFFLPELAKVQCAPCCPPACSVRCAAKSFHLLYFSLLREAHVDIYSLGTSSIVFIFSFLVSYLYRPRSSLTVFSYFRHMFFQ